MTPVRTKGADARQGCFSKGRTLHLVDIENLLGDAYSSEAAVAEFLARYRHRHVQCGDQVVIAANPHLGVIAKLAWPQALVRWARGPDGADQALINEANPAEIGRRFDRLVVASGDHIFEALVKQVRALGVAVLVVHRPGSLSKRLRRSTTTVALEAPVALDLEAA
ncbi:hypothetical protein GCM10027053_47980 [Intrasporangium mesophilum]